MHQLIVHQHAYHENGTTLFFEGISYNMRMVAHSCSALTKAISTRPFRNSVLNSTVLRSQIYFFFISFQFQIDEPKSVCVSICLSVCPSQAIPRETIEVIIIKLGMVTASEMVIGLSRANYIDLDLHSS